MNLIKTVRLLIKPNFMKNDLKQADSLFSRKIISWYEIGGRSDLPWRKNITAYRVWISEIMLQQTQVKTVIPFYKKFIKRYPSLKSLSEATEEDVLALWTGLGFYRRAKNIFKTKEILKNDFKNRFPKSFKDIVSLPGIGNSTAGAIMSIARGGHQGARRGALMAATGIVRIRTRDHRLATKAAILSRSASVIGLATGYIIADCAPRSSPAR